MNYIPPSELLTSDFYTTSTGLDLTKKLSLEHQTHQMKIGLAHPSPIFKG